MTISNELAQKILNNAPEGAEYYGVGDTCCYYKKIVPNSYLWSNIGTRDWKLSDGIPNLDIRPLSELSARFEEQLDTSVEWDDYPPVGVDVMVDYCTDGGCDTWMGFHGPSKVRVYHDDHVWIAHHGVHNRIHKLCDVEFKRVETSEELEAKSRECELNEIADFMKNDKSPSDAEAIYNYVTFKNYRVEK